MFLVLALSGERHRCRKILGGPMDTQTEGRTRQNWQTRGVGRQRWVAGFSSHGMTKMLTGFRLAAGLAGLSINQKVDPQFIIIHKSKMAAGGHCNCMKLVLSVVSLCCKGHHLLMGLLGNCHGRVLQGTGPGAR